ncbi:MAG: amidohydrolase, partial [Acidobacteria bacterium]|nr:amidohydrolase [Acidobacteriota bacterium]
MRNPLTNPLIPPVPTRLPRRLVPIAALLLAASAAAAQRGGRTDDSGWDTTLARGDAYDLVFETSEGTFMSLDVSPDGASIVFDLLGHVYRVPVTGGRAECLTQDSGVAVNYHPRWSPDGATIAFVSDRGGQSNLWLMDADGGN